MTKLRRLLRNVPVLRFGAGSTLAVLIATAALAITAAPAFLPAPVLAAEAPGGGGAAPQAMALPADITPLQAEALKQAILSGAPIPPEVQKLLDSRPDLKGRFPQDLREKPDPKEREKAADRKAGLPPAASPEAPARYDWRSSIYVANLFSKRLHDAEVRTLGHFGHELFAPRPGGAVTLENMPVSPDYIVGPGDEVIVKMWGRVEGTQRMVVDRDGKIFFPKIGSLYVAGKTFAELKSFLKSKVSTIAEVSSDVALGEMKGIRVSVVGEAIAPGWYNVSS
ncbi:MAG: polysaccharide biosynthesis/export family protein, partial [Candidatus Deferrimicrobiaceae bacterium]